MATAGRILVGLSILALGYGGGVFLSQQKVTQEPTAQHIGNAPLSRHSVKETSPKIRSPAERLGIPDQMLAASQHNPVDAWRAAHDISDLMQRAETQVGILVNWARSDPAAALEASEEVGDIHMRQMMQSEVLALLAVKDSAAAFNWLYTQSFEQRQYQMTHAFMSSLAAKDPDLAQSSVTHLPETQRNQVELSIWTQRGGSDPEGAAAWISTLSDQNRQQRIGAAHQLLTVLGMTSQETADRFFEALPKVERTKVESTYVQMLAHSDPRRAAQRLEQLSDEGQRTATATRLVSNWAYTDPDEARRWIERQPNNATPELYHALGAAWAHQNASAAQDFAQRQDSGADRDQLLAGIISSGRIHPRDAEQMLQRISDPELRESTRQVEELRRGYRWPPERHTQK